MHVRIDSIIPGGPRYSGPDRIYELPSLANATIDGVPGVPAVVSMGVRFQEGGPPYVERIEVTRRLDDRGRPTTPPLTGETLRAIAVATLAEAVGEASASVLVRDLGTDREQGAQGGALRDVDDSEVRAVRRALRAGPPADRHRRVAAAYRAAIDRGSSSPNGAVADALGVAPRTAQRYVYEARRAGVLAPAPQRGIAGEVTS